MPDFITHLPDAGLWMSGVVAGFVALGWLLRKAWRGYRKLSAFMEKAEVVLDIAAYEMQHNGGGSIKDAASKLPGIAKDVADLKEGAKVLRAGAVGIAEQAAQMRTALDAHVDQANDIHEEQAAAIAHLAEALPIIARSTPHEDDREDAHVNP